MRYSIVAAVLVAVAVAAPAANPRNPKFDWVSSDDLILWSKLLWLIDISIAWSYGRGP